MNNIFELSLFETCPLDCVYCWYAETGKTKDTSQLAPYRNEKYIHRLAQFFCKFSSGLDVWDIYLTGGEPLLMPNFPLFARDLTESKSRIFLITGLSPSTSSENGRFLLSSESLEMVDSIFATIHPEFIARRDEYFNKLEALKKTGHHVVCKIVGHPGVLKYLPELDERCRKLDICFYPTFLSSPQYPQGYTTNEKQFLERYMRSVSCRIQMEGSLDVSKRKCMAGTRIFASYLGQSPAIYPCISTTQPIVGNIMDGELNPIGCPVNCFLKTKTCTCEIHFQQKIIDGIDDSKQFDRIREGYCEPLSEDAWQEAIQNMKLEFSKQVVDIGQVKRDIKLKKS